MGLDVVSCYQEMRKERWMAYVNDFCYDADAFAFGWQIKKIKKCLTNRINHVIIDLSNEREETTNGKQEIFYRTGHGNLQFGQ